MKKILLSPGSVGGETLSKETAQQTIQRLTAHNVELKGELKKYKTDETRRAADEKIIVEKMAHGLSRQQAMNVIHRQREFDEAAKPKSKASKSKSKGK